MWSERSSECVEKQLVQVILVVKLASPPNSTIVCPQLGDRTLHCKAGGPLDQEVVFYPLAPALAQCFFVCGKIRGMQFKLFVRREVMPFVEQCGLHFRCLTQPFVISVTHQIGERQITATRMIAEVVSMFREPTDIFRGEVDAPSVESRHEEVKPAARDVLVQRVTRQIVARQDACQHLQRLLVAGLDLFNFALCYRFRSAEAHANRRHKKQYKRSHLSSIPDCSPCKNETVGRYSRPRNRFPLSIPRTGRRRNRKPAARKALGKRTPRVLTSVMDYRTSNAMAVLPGNTDLR